MPFFSIVIPVYNIAKYLRVCIDSVLGQHFRNYEMILVDDGSTDGSSTLCDEYVRRDVRVKAIHQKNGGLVSARKAGLQAASGEYVLNVDGDDWIAEGLLSEVAGMAVPHAPDVISFGYTRVGEAGETQDIRRDYVAPGLYSGAELAHIQKNLVCSKAIRQNNEGWMLYSLCTKAVRRELLRTCQRGVPEDITLGEDLAVTLALLERAKTLAVLPSCGYCYRQRDGSMIHDFRGKGLAAYRRLFDYLYREAEKVPRENIDAFAYKRVEQYILEAARYYSSYADFHACLTKELGSREDEIIRMIQPWNMEFREYMKMMAVKRHLYRPLWRWYHH